MTLEDAFHDAWVGKVDPLFPGRLMVDARSDGLSTTGSGSDNLIALNTAFGRGDVVMMPFGGRYLVSGKVSIPGNKILWAPGSVSQAAADVGPVLAPASGFTDDAVVELGVNSELHGVRVDAGTVAATAVSVPYGQWRLRAVEVLGVGRQCAGPPLRR